MWVVSYNQPQGQVVNFGKASIFNQDLVKMNNELILINLERYLRFFWALFLSLIISLFLLEVLYIVSIGPSHETFLSYWFSKKSLSHTVGIIGGFALAGVAIGAWLNSRHRVGLLLNETEGLKEMIQAKIDFISFVSHEVRSPVTGLRYILQKLLDTNIRRNLSIDQVDLLTKAYSAAQDLNSLVSEFLDTSKVDSSRLELLLKREELSNLVAHITIICSEFQPLLNSKQITLKIQAPLDQNKAVVVDATRIFQVVRNLLQNAINYTPPKGTITLLLQTTATDFEFSIVDSGIGIPKGEQVKIFGKYYRALNARKTHSSGTGLGLFLCKKLIEGHQGRIWFTSEENKGASFTFTIPLRSSPATEDLFRRI